MQRNDDDGDDGGAMDRLNAMGNGDRDPVVIVPATEDSAYDNRGGPPTQAMPTAADPFPTIVQPAVHVNRPSVVEPIVRVQPVQTVPVMPRPIEAPMLPPRRDWGPVLIAGFLALLIGGAIGFLIGRSGDSDEETLVPADASSTTVAAISDQVAFDTGVDNVLTLLLAQADQNGSVVLPTPYPKLDQLLTLAAQGGQQDASNAEGDVAAITAERDLLAGQVTELETQAADLQDQLTAAEQERDALQADVDSGSGDDQPSADQIAQLQDALAGVQSNLETANRQLATVQTDLGNATSTLDNLGISKTENVVGRSIGDVRTIARTNGWSLVERPVDSTSATADTVILQTPTNATTMIRGSVLYVEVATTPGG